MDVLGLQLADAESLLRENNREYVIVKTYALKPLGNADDTRVIRVRDMNGIVEITVSEFVTHV